MIVIYLLQCRASASSLSRWIWLVLLRLVHYGIPCFNFKGTARRNREMSANEIKGRYQHTGPGKHKFYILVDTEEPDSIILAGS